MKLIMILILSFLSFGCHKYSDETMPSETKEKLGFSMGYNNSDWKIFDLNDKEIIPPEKYDNIPKIMKLDVKLISKNPKTETIYMWYGGPDNINNNGETPITYNPIALVSVINLAELNSEYKIYPPKNSSYRAWSIPSDPIATSEINNGKNLEINQFLEPETYLTVIKKDIYLIDNDRSFVERKYKTSYGIFGGMYYGMKFTKNQIFRRASIFALSPHTKEEISFDSGFINVSTTYK